MNYTLTQRPVAEGFRLGQIAGHLIGILSDRLTLFTEVSATPNAAGFSIEAERLFLRYDHCDLLRLSAGRYHTPISYWNTAFHHGQWLQTSTGRPDMVRGGSGLMPLHFVGVLAEGTIARAPLGLRYSVGAGNGRAANIARAGDAGDANGSRAVVASAVLSIPSEVGLSMGGSVYADRASPSATLSVDERIVSFHVARERETPEVIVEYAHIKHSPRNIASPVTYSNAAYAQLGYRLPGRAHAFKPYVRAERTRVPAQDTLFAPLRLNQEGLLGGLRVDLAPTAALKIEYRSEKFDTPLRYKTLALQLSFTFPSFSQASKAPPDPSPSSPNDVSHTAHRH
ncbi:MAG TPA: hypothetical protein VJ717_00120 [Gemmatimonadaceae bacterium]|nr:hypothetical protein [Gemmatimonadaceae bacterium]